MILYGKNESYREKNVVVSHSTFVSIQIYQIEIIWSDIFITMFDRANRFITGDNILVDFVIICMSGMRIFGFVLDGCNGDSSDSFLFKLGKDENE